MDIYNVVSFVGTFAADSATLACLMTGAVAGTFFHAAESVLRVSGG